MIRIFEIIGTILVIVLFVLGLFTLGGLLIYKSNMQHTAPNRIMGWYYKENDICRFTTDIEKLQEIKDSNKYYEAGMITY